MIEARAAAALNHPNICTLHDIAESEDHVFIVMECVYGLPLSELVTHDGLPTATVVHYGTQIAAALAHAHERGVVHRDLKAANVMAIADGRVKVLDFGLARRLERSETETMTRAPTMIGAIAGLERVSLRANVRSVRKDPRFDTFINRIGAVPPGD